MTNLSPAQATYLQKQQKHRRMISASRITLLVVFLSLWEIAADSGRIDAFIFSCPSRLTRTCLSMCRDGSLFLHTGITLAETLISFLLVLVIGTLAAILLWLSRQFSEIMEPYLVVLNSSSSGWAPTCEQSSPQASPWPSSAPSSAYTPVSGRWIPTCRS